MCVKLLYSLSSPAVLSFSLQKDVAASDSQPDLFKFWADALDTAEHQVRSEDENYEILDGNPAIRGGEARRLRGQVDAEGVLAMTCDDDGSLTMAAAVTADLDECSVPGIDLDAELDGLMDASAENWPEEELVCSDADQAAGGADWQSEMAQETGDQIILCPEGGCEEEETHLEPRAKRRRKSR